MELCGSSPEMALILASLALEAVKVSPRSAESSPAPICGFPGGILGGMVGAEFWQPHLLRTGAEHKPADQPERQPERDSGHRAGDLELHEYAQLRGHSPNI